MYFCIIDVQLCTHLSITLAVFLVVNCVLCDDTIGSLRREPGHKDGVSRHDQSFDGCGGFRDCNGLAKIVSNVHSGIINLLKFLITMA